jgi:methionine-rich copper-binding protein CopC
MNTKTLSSMLIGGLLLAGWPLIGTAHTHMEKSDPAKDAVLATAPKAVQLWFTEKVAAEWSKIQVTDAKGNRVDKEKVTGDANDAKHIQVELNTLQSGVYQVKWNVISGDGHRVKGEFSFSVQ